MIKDYSKLKNKLDYKIFVIGFNKTATTSIHNFFSKNGLSALHAGDSPWKIEKFQCFSDNGNKRDWKKLSETYPNSIFILNTRRMDKWIISRSKHYSFSKWKVPRKYPPSTKLFKEWILKRHNHYTEVLEFFKKSPDRLYIVDIDKEGWIEYLAKMLTLKPFKLHSNKLKDSVIPLEFMELTRNELEKACNELKLTEKERSSCFIQESLCKNKEYTKYQKSLLLYNDNIYF